MLRFLENEGQQSDFKPVFFLFLVCSRILFAFFSSEKVGSIILLIKVIALQKKTSLDTFNLFFSKWILSHYWTQTWKRVFEFLSI